MELIDIDQRSGRLSVRATFMDQKFVSKGGRWGVKLLVELQKISEAVERQKISQPVERQKISQPVDELSCSQSPPSVLSSIVNNTLVLTSIWFSSRFSLLPRELKRKIRTLKFSCG